jgi:glycosyltransferase involved in cell wall biosynthesis
MMDRRCQVLFLIPSLRGGGAERVIVTLLRHLDRTRFHLTLAVLDLRQAVYRDDVPQGVEVIDLGCSRVRYALPKIFRLVWKRRPNVVFSTLGHLNLALAFLRPLLPNGVRYIARETSIVSVILQGYPFSAWWHWAYRRVYSRFDTVVCQSRYMRDDLVGKFDFPSARAVVIHNPVDIDRIRVLATENVITGMNSAGNNDGSSLIHLVAAGRMAPEKGFDLLIEALALCDDPRLRLTLLGDGPLRDELEALAVSKGVAGQVRFSGFQKNPFPFFAQADAFVLSSRFEGFPNVILEALACGTQVIAVPATGGVREILEDIHDCIIAEAVSSESLATAITQWVAKGMNRLEDKAVVSAYAVERIARRYEEIIAG